MVATVTTRTLIKDEGVLHVIFASGFKSIRRNKNTQHGEFYSLVASPIFSDKERRWEKLEVATSRRRKNEGEIKKKALCNKYDGIDKEDDPYRCPSEQCGGKQDMPKMNGKGREEGAAVINKGVFGCRQLLGSLGTWFG